MWLWLNTTKLKLLYFVYFLLLLPIYLCILLVYNNKSLRMRARKISCHHLNIGACALTHMIGKHT